ncbi:hypothetical protein SprV_0602047600 [Sparganum proliferum]
MSPHPDQRPLPSSNAREGHLAEPAVATLAPDGLCPNTEARPAGRTGDEDDLGYRRPSCPHLKDEEAPTDTQETPRNELTQRPANLPVPAAAVAADNEKVSVEKRWYRRHRSTTDIIFAARQLQKKCPEMRIHVYSTFVYRTKVFDTVNREGLWKSMRRFGCPERFNSILRQHNDRMTLSQRHLQ